MGPHRLTDPLTNKGTAFTPEERRRLHLEGRLPPRMESLEEQAAGVLANMRAREDPLERYRHLSAVQNENETLFYRVVLDHLEETLPIIYTPTVGEACLAWSRLYERPRGLYISAAQHEGRVTDLLRHWPRRPGIIVVTDGGRILGLGDLGANGMGIPIGKLALYTACAGVPPEMCLPVTLDVGTDIEPIRNDAMYLGDRRPRLAGEPYDAFLEEFIAATQMVFPGTIVQFEDFNNACAFRLLRCYRDRLCCFNDDIQGTGAMGLAGLYSAGRITGRPLNAWPPARCTSRGTCEQFQPRGKTGRRITSPFSWSHTVQVSQRLSRSAAEPRTCPAAPDRSYPRTGRTISRDTNRSAPCRILRVGHYLCSPTGRTDETKKSMSGQPRILVAEDDYLLLTMVAEALERMGADVARAGTGAELVLHLVEDGPFDLVVTDISMPWMDGLQAMRSVRYAGLAPALIFITGLTNGGLTDRVAALGRRAVLLRKPFELAELESAVRELLPVKPALEDYAATTRPMSED